MEPRAMDSQVQGQGGREDVWPLPKDIKEAIDLYLKLDRRRREGYGAGNEKNAIE